MDPAERLQLPVPWTAWGQIALASVAVPMAEWTARFGPPNSRDPEGDGLGPEQAWGFRFRCGLEVVLEGLEVVQRLNVHSDVCEADHALRHLGVADRVFWRADPAPFIQRDPRLALPQPFRVIRQDDGGVRYVLAEVASEREARCLVQLYEARAHKQTYWAEPSDGAKALPGSLR